MLKRLSIFFGLALSLMLLCTGMQLAEFVYRPIVSVDSLTIKIPSGQSVRDILKHLSVDQNVEPFSPLWFEVFIRLQQKSHKIQAGEYLLQKGITGQQLLKQIVEGQVTQYTQTIIEGWSFRTLRQHLHENPAIKNTMISETDPVLPFLKDSLSLSPEGLFFPETYYFPKGTTDVEFLKRAHDLMVKQLEIAWQARSESNILKTPYELLILASIIEKETQLAQEWPLVAQVFHNRLNQGIRLQADPTVIYGLGPDFDGDITREHLKRDTPYNSYTQKGLPPTPIAAPSFGALLSAAKPAQGSYLYFVAKGDGSHHFSTTLKEHQDMVNKYIKRQS